MFQSSATYELAQSIQNYHLENVEKAQMVRQVMTAVKFRPGRRWSLKFRPFSRNLGLRPAVANSQ